VILAATLTSAAFAIAFKLIAGDAVLQVVGLDDDSEPKPVSWASSGPLRFRGQAADDPFFFIRRE